MAHYLGDKPYDFAVVVFDGPETADEAYDMMKTREERTGMTIQEAAVFNRKPIGKIKLKNKGFIAGWKGGTIGLGVPAHHFQCPRKVHGFEVGEAVPAGLEGARLPSHDEAQRRGQGSGLLSPAPAVRRLRRLRRGARSGPMGETSLGEGPHPR